MVHGTVPRIKLHEDINRFIIKIICIIWILTFVSTLVTIYILLYYYYYYNIYRYMANHPLSA